MAEQSGGPAWWRTTLAWLGRPGVMLTFAIVSAVSLAVGLVLRFVVPEVLAAMAAEGIDPRSLPLGACLLAFVGSQQHPKEAPPRGFSATIVLALVGGAGSLAWVVVALIAGWIR